jgi:hypothetical protein
MPPAQTTIAFVRRHRNFGLFWGGNILASLAMQIESVTIGWQVVTIQRVL